MSTVHIIPTRLATIFFLLMVWLCVLVGFLATPSMFHQINFEYRAYVPELQTKKIAISEQLDALRSSSRELIAEGRKLGLDLRSRSDASYRRSLRDPSGLSPIEPTEVLENEERMTSDDRNAAARRNEIKNSFAGVQAEIENKFEDLAEIDASIFVYSSESNNAFLIARALALGALGALAARLSKFVDGKIGLSGLQPDDVNRIRISMFVGALVSVVVLGLFYTKQITIFQPPGPSNTLPDYWRTTMLCLIAGAFSDRLFNSASKRVDQYLGGSSKVDADGPRSSSD